MKALDCKDNMIASLALAFIPIVYTTSTMSLDNLWALAFILSSLYFVLLRRPVVAGVLLGIAIGCRITSGAMLVPLGVVMSKGQIRRETLRNICAFCVAAGLVGAATFAPNLNEFFREPIIEGRHADLQLLTQDLSITTFRYVPHDLRTKLGETAVEAHLDALNRELVDRLQRGGETFVSNAVVDGHYVLRACIVNFHTAQTDVEAVPEIVARIGHMVDAELHREF